MEEYERLASDVRHFVALNIHSHFTLQLLEWIKRWLPWMQNRSKGFLFQNSYKETSLDHDDTLAGVQRRLDEFRQYRRREKPPRIEQVS